MFIGVFLLAGKALQDFRAGRPEERKLPQVFGKSSDDVTGQRPHVECACVAVAQVSIDAISIDIGAFENAAESGRSRIGNIANTIRE